MLRRMMLAGFMAVSLLTIPSVASASEAVTFHGTFTFASVAWAESPTPAFQYPMGPMEGTWNLNIAGDEVHGQFLIRAMIPPSELGKESQLNALGVPNQGPPYKKGLGLLYAPGWLALSAMSEPLQADSTLVRMFPGLAGQVNDPADGRYLYIGRPETLPATVVISVDQATGEFNLWADADPGSYLQCPPPSAEVPFCWDGPHMVGQVRS